MTRLYRTFEILCFAGVYACCGWLSLTQAVINRTASPVWLGTGLALAGMLAYGVRIWPAVFVGAFVVNVTTSGSVGGSIGIALGNSLEAILGTLLVQKYANGPRAFDRTRTIFAFFIFAAVLSTLASASIGVLSLCLTGAESSARFGQVWLTWWIGNVTSDVIIAPFIILWSARTFHRFSLKEAAEAGGLLLLVALIGEAVFLENTPFHGSNYPLEFIAILPLLWAAFRLGERGAVSCSVFMSLIAWYGTRSGLGPFARGDTNESLLLLQIFSGTITATSLVLASILGERYRADQRLKLQDALSRVLTEAATLKEAAPRILRAICENAGWAFAAFWIREGDYLQCVDVWHGDAVPLPEFTELTCKLKLRKGEGLPGQTWANRAPVVISHISERANLPRAEFAMATGLESAFCFPLLLGGDVPGIIECFDRQPREPDPVFLEKLRFIGNQLGQFIERKRAEAALKANEERFRLASHSEAITLYEQDAEMRYTWLYPLHPEHASALGKTDAEMLPGEDGRRLLELKQEVMRTGEPSRREVRASLPGGIRYYDVFITPRRNDAGQICGVAGAALEITERKWAEEMRARLAAIVECSDDAIVGKTLDGEVTSWNKGAEQVFGYSAAEMIGKSIYTLIPPEKASEEAEILAHMRRGERIAHFQTVRVRKDQVRIHVSLSISPVKDAAGKIVGASKIARDITRQKQMEGALAEAQATLRERAEDLEKRVQERTAALEQTVQSLDGFCYSIAHDLRAPLRALGGFSRELTQEYGHILDENGRMYLDRIRSSAAWMDKLILDLLQYGRLSTAELPITSVNLRDLLQRALAPVQEEVRKRQAVIRIHEPVLAVTANPVMLEQVLVNLLANALKFVPAGIVPNIHVKTELHDGLVRVRISDNGIGIKEQHIDKLFRPFSRLVSGEEFPGTGIGLAIVRKGIERMGGTVGVESKLGTGSCFWIELPEARQAEPDPLSVSAHELRPTGETDVAGKSRLMPVER